MMTGFESIDVSDLARIDGNDFEDFVYSQLVIHEARKRFPTAKSFGPQRKRVADGGASDLSIKIVDPPIVNLFGCLLPEYLGTVTFNCKTGKNWTTELYKDLRNNDSCQKDIEEECFLIAFTNQKIGKKEKEKVRRQAAFIFAVRDHFGPDYLKGKGKGKGRGRKVTAVGPDSGTVDGQEVTLVKGEEYFERIDVRDANDIATYLQCHKPPLAPRYREILGIQNIEGIYNLEFWSTLMDEERSSPDYQIDQPRQDAIDAIHQFLADKTQKCLWVCGAPGVGKSRLVGESCYRSDANRNRFHISLDVDTARKALEKGIGSCFSDLVLVVDECQDYEIQRAVSLFHHKCDPSAKLILVGPLKYAADQVLAKIPTIQLGPLEETQSKDLIRDSLPLELKQNEVLIAKINYLTEGYPWFATLVSKAVSPGDFSNNSTHILAAELALAGRVDEYQTRQIWETTHDQRAKVLLIALFTEDENWGSIMDTTKQELGNAVGINWPDIEKIAQQCEQRGLLRTRKNWVHKYVTPKILSGIIVEKYSKQPHQTVDRLKNILVERRQKINELIKSLYPLYTDSVQS